MENFKAADVEFQARFHHENIAELYGVLLYDQCIHLFMEAGEGGSVLEKLESCGPMREFEIIWVTKQVLRGLEYLHSHNIIHHDIKRNVFIRYFAHLISVLLKLRGFEAKTMVGGLLWMVRGRVRSWVINYVYQSPHSNRNTGMCVCVFVILHICL